MKKELYLFNEIDEFAEKEEKTPEEVADFSQKIMYNIDTVLLLYIDKESLLDDKSSNKYITNKIIYSFTRIFDIGTKSKFNEMNLAEQLVIIKEMLEIIFRDLEVDKKIEGYDENKSAIRNRTLTTVVFDKRTKKPYYLLCAKSIPNTKTSKRSYTPILYDLTENKLITDKSMIDIWGNFYIIKDDDVKLMIENIEVFRNVDKNASTNSVSIKEQLVKLYIKEATPEQLIQLNELIEQGDFTQINLIMEEYTQSIINNLDIKSIENPPKGDSKVIIKEDEHSTEDMDPETFELYTILVLIGEYEKEEDTDRKQQLYTNIQKAIEKYRDIKENKANIK